MSRRGGTLLLILMFALAACGGGGEAATDTVATLPEGRTVRITSIDISTDHRTMTLGFIGHAHPDDSPCSEDYEGWTRVNGGVVEAAVIVTREAGGGVCTQAGLSREVVVELAEPFTGFEVRDVAGEFVLFLTSPGGLVELPGFADGWELRTESGVTVGLPFGGWTRVYSPMANPTAGDPQVEFVQAFSHPAMFVVGRYNLLRPGPPDRDFNNPTSVTVGGVQGSLYEHQESGDLILVWQQGDDGLALVANDRDFTGEQLIALAEATGP